MKAHMLRPTFFNNASDHHLREKHPNDPKYLSEAFPPET